VKPAGLIPVCAALGVVWGCRSQPPAPAAASKLPEQRAVLEERARLVFTNAVLCKPRETLPASVPAMTFAPLLIREVAGSNAPADAGPDTVYYQLGATTAAGAAHPQMTYLWANGPARAMARGLRVTLDLHGLPAIWEVLDERPGPRVVFVSASLEARARAAFGPPLPGRRFAVEPSLSAAPDVLVARVIDDGPAAMGPIVHETAGGEISAVICRCMPTQARRLVATTYYNLQPLSAAPQANLIATAARRSLAEALRLPAGF
jgi:hypothetical protein